MAKVLDLDLVSSWSKISMILEISVVQKHGNLDGNIGILSISIKQLNKNHGNCKKNLEIFIETLENVYLVNYLLVYKKN